MYNRNRHIETVISNLNRELTKLVETSEGILNKAMDTPSMSKDLEIDLLRVSIVDMYNNLDDFTKYWLGYCKTFETIDEQDPESIVTALDASSIENRLDRYNEDLDKFVDKLKVLEEATNTLISHVNSAEQGLAEVCMRLDPVVPLLEQQVRLREGDKKMHPHYRKDIDDEDLVRAYLDNGYIINQDMQNKFKMSYQGIRTRLIAAGVYIDKTSRNK